MDTLPSTANEFQEYVESSGIWGPVGSSLGPSQLGVTGGISSPSLTADGLTLVFVEAGAGVRYVQRTSARIPFSVGFATSGLLRSSADVLASPHLTPSCRTLYVIDRNLGQHLYSFIHP